MEEIAKKLYKIADDIVKRPVFIDIKSIKDGDILQGWFESYGVFKKDSAVKIVRKVDKDIIFYSWSSNDFPNQDSVIVVMRHHFVNHTKC